jgi:ABC-type lipoprotein export system ATPase subunit/5S rRNA maturation endonuclease (ribonuclease M5)
MQNVILNEEKTKILEINTKGDAGLADFNWKPNAGLNIITGINGSGKTKLLDFIHFKSFVPILKPSQYSNGELIRFKGEEVFQCKYIPILWRLKSDLSELDEPFYYAYNTHSITTFQDEIHKTITGQVLKILENFTSNFGTYFSEAMLKDTAKAISADDMVKEYFNDNPFDKINKFIKESIPQFKYPHFFDFSFSFTEDAKERLLNHSFNKKNADKMDILFLKSNRTQAKLQPKDLSTGEQIMLFLLLSIHFENFGNASQNKGILLLDELDAHLNPTLTKLYYQLLKKIAEYSQIFITTHDPFLIDMAENEEVFEMQKGGIIKNRNKKSVLDVLAGGLISIKSVQGIMHLFARNTEEKPIKYVLLCEGKDDKVNMVKLLPTEIDIVDCTSAYNEWKFLDLPYNTEKGVKILCLFDNDEGGRNGEKLVKEAKGGFKNTVETLFVSETEGFRMEDVINDEILTSELVSKIKKYFGILQGN